jgi:hypothetical protein
MGNKAMSLEEATKSYAALLVAVRALLVSYPEAPRTRILDMYDAASGDCLAALRASEVEEAQIQQLDIAIARLRLELDAED